VELGIAIAAVLVSVISFAINLRASSAAERHGRMPVLVIQSRLDPNGARGTVGVRNIGSGPALNIVIATATGRLATTDAQRIRVFPRRRARRRYRGDWTEHRHLHPIAVGAERWYRWDHDRAIGLCFTDAMGKPYTLLTSEFGTKIVDGVVMDHPPLSRLSYPEPVITG
jgi:hypothetical protein